MPIKITAAVITAICALVVTLEKHPTGAWLFMALLLVGGLSVAIARWQRHDQTGERDGRIPVKPRAKKPARRK